VYNAVHSQYEQVWINIGFDLHILIRTVNTTKYIHIDQCYCLDVVLVISASAMFTVLFEEIIIHIFVRVYVNFSH
jgi:hypothetical protein